jgi:DNA-binding MarR family transcriptional regulator
MIRATPRTDETNDMTRLEESKPAPGEAEHPDEAPARLRTAVSRLAKRLKPTAAAGSLTTTEVDVLQTAARLGPVKLSQLAVSVGLNPTMLSRVVAKLEDNGLVQRLSDETDGRVCRVEVSAAGRELHDRVRSERTDVLSSELDLLSKPDRHAVMAALPALERLAERLLERPSTAAGPAPALATTPPGPARRPAPATTPPGPARRPALAATPPGPALGAPLRAEARR